VVALVDELDGDVVAASEAVVVGDEVETDASGLRHAVAAS
jgi:hypothetical protein